MPVVLDAWAVLALLTAEPGGDRVASEMADSERPDRPVMSWVSLGQVLHVLIARRGPSEAEETVHDLLGELTVELPTEAVVRQAAEIAARHRIGYVPAFAAATAIAYDGELWTGDPELLVPGARWRTRDLRE